MRDSPAATVEVKVGAATGEFDLAGKEEGLCYCGATTDEHEQAFMDFYLFGHMSETLFPEGATSPTGMYADHYPVFLAYMSTSEFVDPGDRAYFEKQLLLRRRQDEGFRRSLPELFEAARRAQQERYASCAPRSQTCVQIGRVVGRVLNGPHRHSFYLAAGGLHCGACGSTVRDTHDLGSTRILESAPSWAGSRQFSRRIYLDEHCIRCGAIPQPFWVSKGEQKLRAWGQTATGYIARTWARATSRGVLAFIAIASAIWSVASWWLL